MPIPWKPGKLYYSKLGLTPYGKALALQRELAPRRAQKEVGNLLLLLEHPPVITLGRHADPAHILAPWEELARRGIEVWQVERGGEATYHGPGQLVGYIICSLREMGLGVRQFVWTLEEALIRTLESYGVAAGRKEGAPGVWAGEAKIAAIGIRVQRGVTYHGFALNIHLDLAPFRLIIPCGEVSTRVTSLAQLLSQAPEPAILRRTLVEELAARLGLDPIPVPSEEIWELLPSPE